MAIKLLVAELVGVVCGQQEIARRQNHCDRRMGIACFVCLAAANSDVRSLILAREDGDNFLMFLRHEVGISERKSLRSVCESDGLNALHENLSRSHLAAS